MSSHDIFQKFHAPGYRDLFRLQHLDTPPESQIPDTDVIHLVTSALALQMMAPPNHFSALLWFLKALSMRIRQSFESTRQLTCSELTRIYALDRTSILVKNARDLSGSLMNTSMNDRRNAHKSEHVSKKRERK